MKKTFLLIIVMACGFMSSHAMAQNFPSYYPEKGFNVSGFIDGLNLGTGEIIIDDSVYRVSPEVVVRSLSSKDDSLTRLRVGANVGFKITGGVITEFWLLPANYKE
jgi:opacity protein-like surface antigen